jgi:hypothetical protein
MQCSAVVVMADNSRERKNVSMTADTYERLSGYGKFEDSGFNSLINRLLDEVDACRAKRR